MSGNDEEKARDFDRWYAQQSPLKSTKDTSWDAFELGRRQGMEEAARIVDEWDCNDPDCTICDLADMQELAAAIRGAETGK